MNQKREKNMKQTIDETHPTASLCTKCRQTYVHGDEDREKKVTRPWKIANLVVYTLRFSIEAII